MSNGPRRDSLRLRMAAIGPVNPLPPLAGLLDPPYDLDLSAAPPSIAGGAAYGGVSTVLPYLVQDGYGRAAEESTVDTVVLDNGLLRATFLPGLGGRLWSLRDLVDDRELLFQPEVLQPANLGLRGAWFAGGVEWNIGTRGHCPFTCDRLHAGFATRADGERVLRMWEYERMRGLVFQVDAWLPEGSRALYVGVRVHNPRTAPVPLYWWSNAAVPQTPGLVVRAPATSAFRTSYSGRLERVPAVDLVPGSSAVAADYFYDVPDDVPEPWISAGLVQRSTGRLRGRKLFCWGESAGGHRWQDWLGGGRYCEVQAGLAATQYEHLPLPPGDWTWVESYGPVGAADLADRLAAFDRGLDGPVDEVVSVGSGWGALENLRRASAGEPPLPLEFTGLGPEQAPWQALLTGGFPETDPVSYVTAEWAPLLASAPASWATAYHLGVLAHAAGDVAGARRRYRESLEHRETLWALRALGLLDDDPDLLVAAHRLAPHLWQLAVEAVEALKQRPTAALELVDGLPLAVRERGRVRLAEARAALAAGDRDRAARLLRDGIEVADLREGEASLDELWWAACPGEPLPARYDYRMKPV